MYLPNIIGIMRIQSMINVVLTHIQNIVIICKQIPFLSLHCVSKI
jgi:hypothetical protein